MKTVTLSCTVCAAPIIRTLKAWKQNQVRNQKPYCSRQCLSESQRTKPRTRPCSHCQRTTTNDLYCSRSCANKAKPRRKPQGTCSTCQAPISSSRSYCPACFKEKFRIDYSVLTLRECKKAYGSRNGYHSVVRRHARSIAEEHQMLHACAICGYSLYVEACHITPVSDFEEGTVLNVVNDPFNLIGLCRNHHWELDHGHLDLRKGLTDGHAPKQ